MLHNLQATQILLRAQEREINRYLERARMLQGGQPAKPVRPDGLIRRVMTQIRR